MFRSSSAPSNNKDQDAILLSSLQVASQSWESFQWSSKLEHMETTLNSSKEAREQSQAARKEIVDTTKQFKRSVKAVEQAKPGAPAATVTAIDNLSKECRVIVKAYQGEIDNLTRRCKNSESAYSTLCGALLELPDPSAVLSTVLEQLQKQQHEMDSLQKTNEEMTLKTQKLQQEVTKKNESGLSREEKEELLQLRADVTQYEIETKGLKDQSVTVRKLEEKIEELQENAVYELQEKIELATQELAETEGRRAADALEREKAMERKVATLELQLKAERAGREAAQTHLLDADEGAGEREAAWEAQRTILVADAEMVRESLHQVTRERDDLRLKVGVGAKTPPPSSGMNLNMEDFMLERTAYEAEVAELAHTVTSLREELKLKDESVMEEKRNLQAKAVALEEENTKLKKSIFDLEGQLASAPSLSLLNSMKRELRILKRLEYNAEDASEDPEMTGVEFSEEDDEKDLDTVLMEKVRRAEAELVKERTIRSEQTKECDRLKEEMEVASKAQEEAEKLVQSLEKDLERAIAAPAAIDTPKAKTNRTMALPNSEREASTLNSILDPDADAPLPPPEFQSTPSMSMSASERADDDHSVATIVMAQRDRLRARCEAMEAERDSFKRELQVQVQSAESLKSDNMKLYEKVRHLQNFGNNNNRGGAVNKRGGTGRDLDLEALEERYEASIDPFRQFSKLEQRRKMQEMNPMDRVVFILAKTVLGTKFMRTGLFLYMTALHLLVFITTAHWSHASTCDHSDHEHLAHLPPHVHEAAKALRGG